MSRTEFHDDDDENQVLDCPACGREYDEIDVDYMICTKCGFNANDKTTDRRIIRKRGRVGIDPDASLDDWSC